MIVAMDRAVLRHTVVFQYLVCPQRQSSRCAGSSASARPAALTHVDEDTQQEHPYYDDCVTVGR
jgi:hypothetical protein